MYFILEGIFSLLINNTIGSKTILTNVTSYINNIIYLVLVGYIFFVFEGV